MACQDFLSFTLSQSLLKFMSIESMMLSNHLIFCHPLLLLPSFFPNIRVFSNKSALCIRWPKYWSLLLNKNNYLNIFLFTNFNIVRIDTFKLWCWRRLLRIPWTARRSTQSILKETNPEYSLEGLMLKLKVLYFGHLM